MSLDRAVTELLELDDRAVANRHIILRGIDQMCNCCSVFTTCDCLASTYLGIAISFFFFGTVMMFNGESEDVMSKFELRPACLIGFVFISTSLVVALKSLIYLRRKNVIILLRNRHPVSMNLGVPITETPSQRTGPVEDRPLTEFVVRNASAATLPPAYDETIIAGSETGENQLPFAPVDTPPPSYDEALYLMSVKTNVEDETEKSVSMEAVNRP